MGSDQVTIVTILVCIYVPVGKVNMWKLVQRVNIGHCVPLPDLMNVYDIKKFPKLIQKTFIK